MRVISARWRVGDLAQRHRAGLGSGVQEHRLFAEMRWPEAHARRAVLEAARGPWLRGAARALSMGRSPPSPRKPAGLSSLVLGHAAALTGKSKDAGVMMLEAKGDWYADAASDTVLLSMAGPVGFYVVGVVGVMGCVLFVRQSPGGRRRVTESRGARARGRGLQAR